MKLYLVRADVPEKLEWEWVLAKTPIDAVRRSVVRVMPTGKLFGAVQVMVPKEGWGMSRCSIRTYHVKMRRAVVSVTR